MYTAGRSIIGSNKTILVSSNVRISKDIKQQIRIQPAHSHLRLLPVTRLGIELDYGSEIENYRQEFYSSLDIHRSSTSKGSLSIPKWYEQIVNATGHTYNTDDFETIPDDVMKRVGAVVSLLANAQINKHRRSLQALLYMTALPSEKSEVVFVPAVPALTFSNVHYPASVNGDCISPNLNITIELIQKSFSIYDQPRPPTWSTDGIVSNLCVSKFDLTADLGF